MTARTGLRVGYGEAVEEAAAAIVESIAGAPEVDRRYNARWLALELIEDGADLRRRLATVPGGPDVVSTADRAVLQIEERLGATACVAVADGRYRYIHEIVEAAVTRTSPAHPTRSDRLDRAFMHRYLGVPLFLFAMWATLELTADASAAFVDWIDTVISGPIARWAAAGVAALGLGGSWVEGLAVDGILAGVGGVLTFVPVLMTLYLALAILDDTGYMARAAVVMDRTMRALGLPGKSFLPMMVGFGCTVPAIYATRTLERRKDRVLTGLLVPFMSCAARLPVYVLFAAVFFPRHRGLVVFSMYLMGIAVALVVGTIANRSLFRRRTPEALIIELPAYRLPNLRSVWSQMWQRTWAFVKNAGTVILATSMAVWLLMAIPVAGGEFGEVEIEDSAFTTVSEAVAPAFAPAGFGSWEATGALASGFVAKEVVVSSLAQVYGVADGEAAAVQPDLVSDLAEIGTELGVAVRDTLAAIPGVIGIDLLGDEEPDTSSGLTSSIRNGFERSSGGHGALAAIAFMVFVLLYTPCMAAVAAERHELGARWMWASVLGQTALAWLASVVVFQAGRLLGWG